METRNDRKYPTNIRGLKDGVVNTTKGTEEDTTGKADDLGEKWRAECSRNYFSY